MERQQNPVSKMRSTSSRFKIAYWALVGVGVIAVVVGFVMGTQEQRIWTGVIVTIGVVILTSVRFILERRRA